MEKGLAGEEKKKKERRKKKKERRREEKRERVSGEGEIREKKELGISFGLKSRLYSVSSFSYKHAKLSIYPFMTKEMCGYYILPSL